MINSSIDKYLNYYSDLDTSPRYAVLINGKWGVGKTWYIQNFIDKAGKDKYLYVSLYGITSYKQIENEFFSALHPILSSKPAAFAKNVFASALKATIKYDWNNDGINDGQVEIPLKIPNFLSNAADRILIFDDIERCSIPISELLGYINNFVEHLDYKAILIANDEEIGLSQDSIDYKLYGRIKEKLIGKTLEVRPDIDSAYKAFLDVINDPSKKHLLNNEQLIKEIFKQSGYANFRHLRQALLDMDRVIKIFPVKAKSVPELMTHFIKYFLIFFIEVRNGNLKAEELRKLSINNQHLFSKKPAEKGPYEVLRDKYNTEFYRILLEKNLWADMIASGIVDERDLRINLDNSEYFAKENANEWVQLWHYGDEPDSKVGKVFDAVRTKYDNKNYDSLFIVLHVVGMFINFSKIGMYKKSIPAIKLSAKRYIDHLVKKGKFSDDILNGGFWSETHAGLGYYCKDDAVFREIIDYCKQKALYIRIKSYPEKAKQLIKDMVDSPEVFFQKLDVEYRMLPILQYCNKREFVRAFVSLTSFQRATVIRIFAKRYESSSIRLELAEEKPWLSHVARLLGSRARNSSHPVTRDSLVKASKNCQDFSDEL